MIYWTLLWQLIFVSYPAAHAANIIKDVSTIKKYWANLREYKDLAPNHFGVKSKGLPRGCTVEQVQIVHRHAARYPSSEEFLVIKHFADKVASKPAGESFRGDLSFLNTWTLRIGSDLLVAAGVGMEYESGTYFWTKYGRLLYDATPEQTWYNQTDETKPLLRCNTLSRILNSARAWAQGFFGPYDATSKYRLLQVPYRLYENNTLASFLTCLNYVIPSSSISQFKSLYTQIAPLYLENAKARFSKYIPAQVNLTVEDIFAMQALCPYEYYTLGSSDFCRLFTLDEWKGFEYAYDTTVYRSSSFGSPAGRALGIGLLEEIIARLNKEYIRTSDSSVNYTLSSKPSTFPLNQKIYLDMTHDVMILGVLTAMSLDYFRHPLPLEYPPPKDRVFHLSELTPYAARLVIEKIGCASPSPVARRRFDTQYTRTQYNYSPSKATHKFVRIRLNNAILPLNTIRNGACDIRGRSDGMCPLKNFIQSQANAKKLANFQFVCFGNYTIDRTDFDGDGTYIPPL